MLGGWNGQRSIIDNLESNVRCVQRDHTSNEFNSLKQHFRISIADNYITIWEIETNQIFLECSNEQILKYKLTLMSGSSGPNRIQGHLRIMKNRKRLDSKLVVGKNFIAFADDIPYLKQIINATIDIIQKGPKLLTESKIFDINDQILCQKSHFQWTEWLSEKSTDGNDVELLSNYQRNYK